MTVDYPALHRHLEQTISELGHELPGAMRGFYQLHTESTAPGVLSKSAKELMALAISICVHCDGCIAYHTHDALRAGATHEEVVETIGVAVMMGGGPAAVYGAQAFEALSQFEEQAQS
jgi:AhpD family alkylhydroperoxidase